MSFFCYQGFQISGCFDILEFTSLNPMSVWVCWIPQESPFNPYSEILCISFMKALLHFVLRLYKCLWSPNHLSCLCLNNFDRSFEHLLSIPLLKICEYLLFNHLFIFYCFIQVPLISIKGQTSCVIYIDRCWFQKLLNVVDWNSVPGIGKPWGSNKERGCGDQKEDWSCWSGIKTNETNMWKEGNERVRPCHNLLSYLILNF